MSQANERPAKRIAFISGVDSPLSGYVLQALIDHGCTPTCIVLDRRPLSAKDREVFAQRTAGLLPPWPVEGHEQAAGCLSVDNHNSAEAVEAMQDKGCRVVVNGGTPRILNGRFLSAFDAVLNCHPGLLPAYRGCTCVEWSVFNDDPVGNSVHLMRAGIDEGPVVCAETVAVAATDDYPAVRVKVFRHGFTLLAEVARQVANGEVDVAALPEQGAGTYWRPMDEPKLHLVMEKLRRGAYRHQA